MKIFSIGIGILVSLVPGCSPKKLFSCQLCGKVLCSKASLKRHIADKHAERQEEYRCIICERVYCSRNSLMTHIYTYHKSRPGELDIKDIKFFQGSIPSYSMQLNKNYYNTAINTSNNSPPPSFTSLFSSSSTSSSWSSLSSSSSTISSSSSPSPINSMPCYYTTRCPYLYWCPTTPYVRQGQNKKISNKNLKFDITRMMNLLSSFIYFYLIRLVELFFNFYFRKKKFKQNINQNFKKNIYLV